MSDEADAEIAVRADEPAGSSNVYALIRNDILGGRLGPNERLKASALAARYGTSNNPVREALQQLRGEGLVVITPNRGARVRTMDDGFIRNLLEIEMLVEPYLTRWFVDIATRADLLELEAIEDRIEALNFSDAAAYTELDTQFHRVIYDRHYNRPAVDLWWKHREILSAMARDIRFASWREEAIVREHRALIGFIRAHDASGAAEIVAAHVRGSGTHLSQQLRARLIEPSRLAETDAADSVGGL